MRGGGQCECGVPAERLGADRAVPDFSPRRGVASFVTSSERRRNQTVCIALLASRRQKRPLRFSLRRRTVSACSAFLQSLYALKSSSHIFALFSPCAAAPAFEEEGSGIARRVRGAEISARRESTRQSSGMRARVRDGDAHASALLDASAHPDAAASCVKPSVCIPIARDTTLLHRATRCEDDEEWPNVLFISARWNKHQRHPP